MRVGLAGLGFMGAAHAQAVLKISGARLQAVCGTNPRRLAGDFSDVAGNLGAPFGQLDFAGVACHSDWRTLVADPNLDVIDICLPTGLHAEVAIAALQAGKHVLCEKPMALHERDCQSMLGAAEASDRILMIGQVLRFFPEYQWLAEAVRSGRYGRVLQATFIRRTGLPDWSTWLPRREESGGAVLDLLIHDIDQALWLFGMPEKLVANEMGPVDTVMASLLYRSGPEVRIQGGWFAPGSAFAMSYRVRFEKAEAELTSGELFVSDREGSRTKVELERNDPYATELEYFLDCCRDNLRPEICLPDDSAAAVQAAVEIRNQLTSKS